MIKVANRFMFWPNGKPRAPRESDLTHAWRDALDVLDDDGGDVPEEDGEDEEDDGDAVSEDQSEACGTSTISNLSVYAPSADGLEAGDHGIPTPVASEPDDDPIMVHIGHVEY